jgi:hypothetical protein
MRRYFAPLAILCGCALAGSSARADADSDRLVHARALGEQAADLLDAKNYAEALARATQAESLFHAPTHVLMIAEANEGLGHLAAAADGYEALVAEPLPRSAPRAFLSAQATGKQRLTPLLARVPALLIKVLGTATSSARASVDGRSIPLRAGVAVRLDAGRHALRVTSQGFRTSEQTVSLPDRGGVTILEVVLEPDPTVTVEATPATTPAVEPPAAPPPPPPPPAPPDKGSGSRSRLPAYVAFGAGGAGIVLGSVTGVVSLTQASTLKGHCTANVCPPTDASMLSSARTLGWVSTVAFGVGIAGIGAGVALLLLRPAVPADASTDKTASGPSRLTPSFTPWIGLGSAGVEGRF